MPTLWRHLSLAFRRHSRQPGFTAAILLVLALGIGANVAIFSVLEALVLRPLPYAQSERLVQLRQEALEVGIDHLRFSVPEVVDYRRESRTLLGVAEYHSMPFDLLGGEEPTRVQTGVVSADYFDLLGVQPMLGRGFLAGDDRAGAEPVLLLTQGFWQRRFGADPGVVGRRFILAERSITAVGVLPPLPHFPEANDVYMPTSACPFRSAPQAVEVRNRRMLSFVFGRLRPGVDLREAQAELSTIAGRLRAQYPEVYDGSGYDVRLVPMEEEISRAIGPVLGILLAAAGLVLLTACANVASLTLAQLEPRERELAVRTALGASRGRVIHQLLIESLSLAAVGGTLGLGVAYLGQDVLADFVRQFTVRTEEVSIDGPVLGFSIALSLLTGVAFGLIPALRGGRTSVAAALQEGGPQRTAGVGHGRFRSCLAILQLAVSCLLLVGGGLMIRSYLEIQRTAVGFDFRDVLVVDLDLPFSRYRGASDMLSFESLLLERVEGLPGVAQAGVTASVPFRDGLGVASIEIEGSTVAAGEEEKVAEVRVVTPGFFETLGIHLLEGRLFDETDGRDTPWVVVVNESFARHYWPEGGAVGWRISFDEGATWQAIVGVVVDVRQRGVNAPVQREIYRSYLQSPTLDLKLLVRTSSAPADVATGVRQVVRTLDPQLPIAGIATLEELRRSSVASPRLMTSLLGGFAAVALVIALAGVGGILAFSQVQRRRELGIRMAFGAGRKQVSNLVARQVLVWIGLGELLGLGAAVVLARFLSSQLYGVAPTDPVTFAAVAVLLFVVVALAAWFPLRRTLRMNVSDVLRH